VEAGKPTQEGYQRIMTIGSCICHVFRQMNLAPCDASFRATSINVKADGIYMTLPMKWLIKKKTK